MTTFQQIVVSLGALFAGLAINNALYRIRGLERDVEKLQESIWDLKNQINPPPSDIEEWVESRRINAGITDI